MEEFECVYSEFKEELNARNLGRVGTRLVLGGSAARIHGDAENS